jgi:hypothetical protein
MKETVGGFPLQAQMHIYEGVPYECGCGETHKFSQNRTEVVRELRIMKFVLGCQNGFITLVKIKGFFSYKMTSLLSAKVIDSDEKFSNMSDEERDVFFVSHMSRAADLQKRVDDGIQVPEEDSKLIGMEFESFVGGLLWNQSNYKIPPAFKLADLVIQGKMEHSILKLMLLTWSNYLKASDVLDLPFEFKQNLMFLIGSFTSDQFKDYCKENDFSIED